MLYKRPRSDKFMTVHIKQAGAELCQAQFKFRLEVLLTLSNNFGFGNTTVSFFIVGVFLPLLGPQSRYFGG